MFPLIEISHRSFPTFWGLAMILLRAEILLRGTLVDRCFIIFFTGCCTSFSVSGTGFQPFQLACQKAQGTLKDAMVFYLPCGQFVSWLDRRVPNFFTYTLTLFGHKIGAPIWPAIHKNYWYFWPLNYMILIHVIHYYNQMHLHKIDDSTSTQ